MGAENTTEFDIDHLVQAITSLPAQGSTSTKVQRKLHLSASTKNAAKERMRKVKAHDAKEYDALDKDIKKEKIMGIMRNMAQTYAKQSHYVAKGANTPRAEGPVIVAKKLWKKGREDGQWMFTRVVKSSWGFIKALCAIITTSIRQGINDFRTWRKTKRVFDKLEKNFSEKKKLSFANKIRRLWRALDFSGQQKALNQALVEQYMQENGAEVWKNVSEVLHEAGQKGNDQAKLKELASQLAETAEKIQKQTLIAERNSDERGEEDKHGTIEGELPNLEIQKDSEEEKASKEKKKPGTKMSINYFDTLTDEEVHALRVAVQKERIEYEKCTEALHQAQIAQSVATHEIILGKAEEETKVLQTAIREIDPDIKFTDIENNQNEPQNNESLQTKLNELVKEKKTKFIEASQKLKTRAEEQIREFTAFKSKSLTEAKQHVEQQYTNWHTSLNEAIFFSQTSRLDWKEGETDPFTQKLADTGKNSPLRIALNEFEGIDAQLDDKYQYTDPKNGKTHNFAKHLRRLMPGSGCAQKVANLKEKTSNVTEAMTRYEDKLKELIAAVANQDPREKQKDLQEKADKAYKKVNKHLKILEDAYQENLDLIQKGVAKFFRHHQNHHHFQQFRKKFFGKNSSEKGLCGNTVGKIHEIIRDLQQKHTKVMNAKQKAHEPKVKEIAVIIATNNNIELNMKGLSVAETGETRNAVATSALKKYFEQYKNQKSDGKEGNDISR